MMVFPIQVEHIWTVLEVVSSVGLNWRQSFGLEAKRYRSLWGFEGVWPPQNQNEIGSLGALYETKPEAPLLLVCDLSKPIPLISSTGNNLELPLEAPHSRSVADYNLSYKVNTPKEIIPRNNLFSRRGFIPHACLGLLDFMMAFVPVYQGI